MYRLTDYAAMLADRRRIDAYTRALTAAITPSSVVLDLGAGIGTFSILACKLGAARVYAVEPADVIELAKDNAARNGVEIHFVQARAMDIELPEPVDVIVSDLTGALPLFEEHLASIIHVRDRFLRAGGTLIPQRDRLLCAPVSNAAMYARIVDPWNSIDLVDLGASKAMALNTPHARIVEPRDLAAAPRCWAELDYATLTSPNVSASVEWRLESPRVIHGIAVWFESTLHDDVAFATGPHFPGSVHATMLLPLPEPLRVDDMLYVTIDATLVAGRYAVKWLASTERTSLLLDRGTYYALNETATRIRELLASGHDVASIAGTIAEEFDVDPRRATNDVRAIAEKIGGGVSESNQPFDASAPKQRF